MTEPLESKTELTDKTLEIANESGLEKLIDDISEKYSLDTFELQSQIPVSIDLLEDTNETISVSGNPAQNLQVLHEMINEPETSFEFPFLLTGETKDATLSINNFNLLYSTQESLQSRIVIVNPQLLRQGIKIATESNKNIILIAHTHPNIAEAEKSSILTNRLSEDIKTKYKIKEIGLNFSLQDLYQLVYFQEVSSAIIPETSRVYLGVLMFNGEMNAISIVNGKFKKTKINY